MEKTESPSSIYREAIAKGLNLPHLPPIIEDPKTTSEPPKKVIVKSWKQQQLEKKMFKQRMREEWEKASRPIQKTSLVTKIGWYLPSGKAIQACIALPYIIIVTTISVAMMLYKLIESFL